MKLHKLGRGLKTLGGGVVGTRRQGPGVAGVAVAADLRRVPLSCCAACAERAGVDRKASPGRLAGVTGGPDAPRFVGRLNHGGHALSASGLFGLLRPIR